MHIRSISWSHFTLYCFRFSGTKVKTEVSIPVNHVYSKFYNYCVKNTLNLYPAI